MHNNVFKKNRLIIVTIIVSVSFHLVVLYLMQQSSSSKPLKEVNKTPKVKPLQAKLIFELPPQPMTSPIPEPKQEPKPIDPPAVKVKQATTPVATKITTVEAPPIIIKPKIKVQNKPKMTESVIQKIKTPAKINSQFTGTAGKHIQQYNLEQDAKMAVEASQYYQQQKNSPLMHAPKRNKFMTEDEKLVDNMKIRANCDGTTRKVAATLIGFMGGMVDCTSKPNINGFINKRINKQNLLPAKHKRPLDKLPKSVVIQD